MINQNQIMLNLLLLGVYLTGRSVKAKIFCLFICQIFTEQFFGFFVVVFFCFVFCFFFFFFFFFALQSANNSKRHKDDQDRGLPLGEHLV